MMHCNCCFIFAQANVLNTKEKFMPKIDVKQVSQLAKINFSDNEEKQFESEISEFLDLISSISKAEYKDIEPLYHAPEILSHMREDVSIEVRDSGINCAPEHENSLIIVPKVIE